MEFKVQSTVILKGYDMNAILFGYTSLSRRKSLSRGRVIIFEKSPKENNPLRALGRRELLLLLTPHNFRRVC
jgi:hypothetical protein